MIESKVVTDFIVDWITTYVRHTQSHKLFFVDNKSRNSALLKLCLAEASSKIMSSIEIIQLNGIDKFSDYKQVEETKGILISHLDYTYSKYCRQYNKSEQFLHDIFPLINLYYSEIIEITNKLLPNNNFEEKDDYRLQEWAISLENKYQLITQENSPSTSYIWHSFDIERKKFIAMLHQREKLTRHKAILERPMCIIPEDLLCRNN